MDPITALGAAGSVVGIADVAYKLVKSISKAYAQIASTEVVLESIIDEVESMGMALNQISELVSAEERNVEQGLGFKLFTPVALSDVRKTAEKCLVIFWRIEGIILDKAGTSEFEKDIQTRRAEFRRQAHSKGKGTGSEFGLTEGLADAATSFVRRARWQFKGTIPKLKECSDQLRGYQLVFTVMLATISLQTSQQHQDWNAIMVALTQISTVNKQKAIPDVLADLSTGYQKKRIYVSKRSKDNEEKARNDYLKDFSTSENVSEHITTMITESGAETRPGSNQAHAKQPKVEDYIPEADPASSSDTGQPEKPPNGSPLSGGKPETEHRSQRNSAEEGVESFSKSSIIYETGKKVPEECLSTIEVEGNDSESLDQEHHQVNEDEPTRKTKSEASGTPRLTANQPVPLEAYTVQGPHDPEDMPNTAPVSIRNASPSAPFYDFSHPTEPLRLRVHSQNITTHTSEVSDDEESKENDRSGDRPRLVFIVREGSVLPVPRLSSRGRDQRLTSRFSLRSRGDLGYSEFAFLNDLDRKAVETILEDTKPSDQASVRMKPLKSSSLLGIGKAKSAILVIIEEPGESRKVDRSVADGSSSSGSTAKTGTKFLWDGKMSDEHYFRELTTYKTISIHPLLDVRLPKSSIERVEWENCAKKEVNLDRAEVLRRLSRIDKDGLSVADKGGSLNSQQRLQIQTSLVEISRADMDRYNFEWKIRQLEFIRKRIHLWSFLKPVTVAIVVYLQRSPRPHADLEALAKRPEATMIVEERREEHFRHAPLPPRITWTRMARRYLSLECLRIRGIDYEVDRNPEYVIIKRWVPPQEQRDLWSLTKVIRDGREKVTTTLAIEDRSHHHHRYKSGDNLVVVEESKRARAHPPNRQAPMNFARAGTNSPENPASSQYISPTSDQPQRATGTLKVPLPGVDKEIIDMLLRRWTPGAAEIFDGSKGWASENEEDEGVEQGHEEDLVDD